MNPASPPHDCALCPRLAGYRARNRAANPGWFNAPVPSFGPLDAPLLIVGLAPGLRGANRTGRPFTGDFAGVLLYETLLKLGLARGGYGAELGDCLELQGCRIVNAVRCVPPANLPVPAEIRNCNQFLAAELRCMTRLRAVMTLGVVAHAAMLRAYAMPLARLRFASWRDPPASGWQTAGQQLSRVPLQYEHRQTDSGDVRRQSACAHFWRGSE